ncbi:hypothetical protein CLOP_g9631, partial [Closterium sp. NIES-67]
LHDASSFSSVCIHLTRGPPPSMDAAESALALDSSSHVTCRVSSAEFRVRHVAPFAAHTACATFLGPGTSRHRP